MLKRVILASVFALATTAAFAQAAPPAASGGAGGAPGAPGGAGAPAAAGGASAAPQQPMSFFVTSKATGTGNLGGLAGADKICQDLATAAGSTKTFHAYLSTQAVAAANGQPAQPAVNARDRIGNGPWYNAMGVKIADNVADLEEDLDRDSNYVNILTSVDEKGQPVPGFQAPQGTNRHDILTGSDSTGRAFLTGQDMTCNNWTSDAAAPAGAMLGHTDRLGGNQNVSWQAAHRSVGCDAMSLIRTGGEGRLYCFATN